jgi:hypothetical protein
MKLRLLIAASAVSLLAATAAEATTVGDVTVTDVGTANVNGNYTLLNNVSVIAGSSVNSPVVVGTTIVPNTTTLGSGDVGWNPFGNNGNSSQWLSIGGAGGTNSLGGNSSIAFSVNGNQNTFSLIWGSPSVTNVISLYGAGNVLLGTVSADGNGNLDISSNGNNGVLSNPSSPVNVAWNLSNTTGPGAIIDIQSALAIKEVVLTTSAGSGGFEVGGISAVPIPGALPLFGSALLGIAAFGRRRRAKKSA